MDEFVDAGFRTAAGTVFRFRAAAIIERNGHVLLATNDRCDYFYSVGGGVRVGEIARDALRRELCEETGWELEPGRLVVVHENFFVEQTTGDRGHEVAFYFEVAVPEEFEPRGESVTLDDLVETTTWVPIAALDEVTAYPTWLRDELAHPHTDLRHIVTIEQDDACPPTARPPQVLDQSS